MVARCFDLARDVTMTNDLSGVYASGDDLFTALDNLFLI
jgi:hypothetical protein